MLSFACKKRSEGNSIYLSIFDLKMLHEKRLVVKLKKKKLIYWKVVPIK